MLVIGITGPSGSGKSALTEMYGCPVIDADFYARRAVEDVEVLKNLQDKFGADIVKNGLLDRKALARKAFADEGSVMALNSVTHPKIISLMRDEIDRLRKSNEKLVLVDAPQLYEAGAQSLCDYVIAVTADREIRRARIIARDRLTDEECERRLNIQKDDQYYLERTPYLIANNGSLDQVRKEFSALIDGFLKENK